MNNTAVWATAAANKFREVTRTTENPTTKLLAEGLTYLAEAIRDLDSDHGAPPSVQGAGARKMLQRRCRMAFLDRVCRGTPVASRARSNRAERRRQQRASGARPYRSGNAVYDEFIGELRPPNDRAFTELHIRYVDNGDHYVDWSLTLQARLGDLEDFRQSGSSLERRKL